MSGSVFKKWTNAVIYLNKKMKDNRLIAGRNIQLENTGNGIRIHGSAENNNAVTADEYMGAFKVIKDGENLKVVYGRDPAISWCGEFDVPGPVWSNLRCPVVSFPITAGETHYITLKLVYDIASEEYSAEITCEIDGWDEIETMGNPNPGLAFHVADYTEADGIGQKLWITGGYNSQLRLELKGKYWV